jgi:hypothetical protein
LPPAIKLGRVAATNAPATAGCGISSASAAAAGGRTAGAGTTTRGAYYNACGSGVAAAASVRPTADTSAAGTAAAISTVAAQPAAAAADVKNACRAPVAPARAIAGQLDVTDGDIRSGGDKERTARAHPATGCSTDHYDGRAVAADSGCIGDGEIIDGNVSGINEEAALHAAAIYREVIAVDDQRAGGVDRRQRRAGGERDIVGDVYFVVSAGMLIDGRQRGDEARGIISRQNDLRIRASTEQDACSKNGKSRALQHLARKVPPADYTLTRGDDSLIASRGCQRSPERTAALANRNRYNR